MTLSDDTEYTTRKLFVSTTRKTISSTHQITLVLHKGKNRISLKLINGDLNKVYQLIFRRRFTR